MIEQKQHKPKKKPKKVIMFAEIFNLIIIFAKKIKYGFK